jgi:hypothetical protein
MADAENDGARMADAENDGAEMSDAENEGAEDWRAASRPGKSGGVASLAVLLRQSSRSLISRASALFATFWNSWVNSIGLRPVRTIS